MSGSSISRLAGAGAAALLALAVTTAPLAAGTLFVGSDDVIANGSHPGQSGPNGPGGGGGGGGGGSPDGSGNGSPGGSGPGNS